jgi:nucleolar protein 12
MAAIDIGAIAARKPAAGFMSAAADAAAVQSTAAPVNVAALFTKKTILSEPVKKETRREKRNRELAERRELAKNPAAAAAAAAAAPPVREEPKQQRKKHLSHLTDPIDEEETDRTVFVGNLPNTCTHQKLKAHFAAHCGADAVVSARIRCIRLDVEGKTRASAADSDDDGEGAASKQAKAIKNRGRGVHVLRGDISHDPHASANGYVVLQSLEAAQKALELTGTVYQGRHLSVSRETAEGRAFFPLTSIYVGNLPYNVSDEQLWGLFSGEGGIKDMRRVRVIRDRETNVGKGIAYVEFGSKQSATKALTMREALIAGRAVRITRVHQSKDPALQRSTRREKRILEQAQKRKEKKEQAKKDVEKDDVATKKKDKARTTSTTTTIAMEDGSRPAWMGEVADPRKKLDREVRWLAQHPNDRKKVAMDKKRKDAKRASMAKKAAAAKK